MDADTLKDLVGTLGFPIAVTGYLLIRFDGLMRTLTNSMEALTDEIRRNR